MADLAFRIEALVKVRGHPEAGFRLEAPELALRAGRISAIVGDSGCGKTTLLDILALIARPDRCARFEVRSSRDAAPIDVARLHAESRENDLAAIRAGFGYVLQTGGLLPFLTVFENAATPFRILGAPVDRTRIGELAERLGIAEQLHHWPGALSGGQRQRAAILRALAHRPRIVFADEPTAAVDKRRAREIMEDFARIAAGEQVCVALVTHDQDLIQDLVEDAYGFTLEPTAAGGVRSICRPTTLKASRRAVEAVA